MAKTTRSVSRVDKKNQIGSTFAIIGFSMFILIMFAFHFIQPELNPLKRFGSEYVAGRLGWIMNLAFFCFAGGVFSLAYAFNRELQYPAKSRAGEFLLILAGIGILGSGIFDAHLQGEPIDLESELHSISGLLAFLSMIPAMFVFSRRLRFAGRLKGSYRYLRELSWVVALSFFFMLFVFGPLELVGLGQRIFLGAIFTWLILAARGIQSGAFRPVKDTAIKIDLG